MYIHKVILRIITVNQRVVCIYIKLRDIHDKKRLQRRYDDRILSVSRICIMVVLYSIIVQFKVRFKHELLPNS